MIDTAQLLQEQMDLAESQAESWKQHYDDATDCWALEYLLRMWMRLAEDIGDMDNKIRLRVLQGNAPANAENVVTDLYRRWLQVTNDVLMPFLNIMKGKEYQVEGAEEIRFVCRGVQGILTPDEEFFDGERFVELRDKAIDAHRGGKTEDWEVPVS